MSVVQFGEFTVNETNLHVQQDRGVGGMYTAKKMKRRRQRRHSHALPVVTSSGKMKQKYIEAAGSVCGCERMHKDVQQLLIGE